MGGTALVCQWWLPTCPIWSSSCRLPTRFPKEMAVARKRGNLDVVPISNTGARPEHITGARLHLPGLSHPLGNWGGTIPVGPEGKATLLFGKAAIAAIQVLNQSVRWCFSFWVGYSITFLVLILATKLKPAFKIGNLKKNRNSDCR